jgi:hypothetical protein
MEKSGAKKKPRSAKDIRFRRRSRWSVAIAIAAVASYLLTGELITFVFSEEGEGDREVNEGAAEEVEDAEEEVELEEPLDDDDAEEPPPEAEEE